MPAASWANQLSTTYVNTFLMVFFVNILKIPSLTAGTIFLVATIWDAINDPIMGVICDPHPDPLGLLSSLDHRLYPARLRLSCPLFYSLAGNGNGFDSIRQCDLYLLWYDEYADQSSLRCAEYSHYHRHHGPRFSGHLPQSGQRGSAV